MSSDTIRNQLQSILASTEFLATESQRKFLSFVVLETLAGNSNEIKGFTVATRVFGRGDDFDQATDPIVSIQANKLRKALERYYLVTGHNDQIQIDIPKGTYIPVFTEQSQEKSFTEDMSGADRPSVDGRAWPTILIHPFVNLTGDEALNWLGAGFASGLRMEITQQRDIKVLRGRSNEDGKQATDTTARFVVDGEILKDVEGIQVMVTLTDTSSDMQLWSNRHHCGSEPALLVEFQKKIVQTVVAQIGCEQGIIAKTMLAESTDRAPENLKTYEAILRFIEYFQDPTSEGFLESLRTLEHARKLEPSCGKIWSMLARLYIIVYAFETPGFSSADAREKAISYAEKGVRLAPDTQFARLILGFVRMITDENIAAQREVQMAYDLCPDCVVLLDNIGYVMTLTGKWEKGVELIQKAIERNPYYNNTVHYALWVSWLRKKDYNQAYQETMSLRSPKLFWEPLAKAATLGHLGRLEEGKKYIADLLALMPDFPRRGYILIERFMKCRNAVDLTVAGLKKCGLELI